MEHRPPLAHAAWILDVDGTLYRGLPVKLCMGLELALRAPGRIPLVAEFRKQHERVRLERAAAADSPFALQLERTARVAGCDPEELQRIVSEWMIERPSRWIRIFRRRRLLAAVEAFRVRGGRVAVVSDYPAERKLAALGARASIRVVLANGESPAVRRMKPDPGALLEAARSLEVRPGECLVIGDRDDLDGAAARGAGMSFCPVPRGLRSLYARHPT